jgi:hypothetical protein
MAERLRALLEQPLDARVASAVVALAAAALIGFAVVLALGLSGAASEPAAGPLHMDRFVPRRTAPLGPPPRPGLPGPARARSPRQDPQDEAGTTARLRADRELSGHRALQHLPYRHGGISVALVGARGERAVLRVRARTLAAARRGWRAFLRRYRDSGAAYLPVFEALGRHRG